MPKQPLLGIFWIVRGRIVAFAEPASKVKAVAGFKDSKLGHHRIWQSVLRKHRTLARQEYWEHPRGRVLYAVRDDQYRLFLPTKYRHDKRLIRHIVSRFSLPMSKVAVWTDEHYEPPSDSVSED